jgi:phenylacetate-CoA ligase
MSEGILEDSDRVANLFYVGDLYASFLFIKDSLQWIDPNTAAISQYPIAGNTDFKQILSILEEFQINVICGVPSQILKLLELYDQDRTLYKNLKLKKVLFGGEALYPDQEVALKEIVFGSNRVEWMGNRGYFDLFPQSEVLRRLENLCTCII